MSHIFISYSRKDQPYARALAEKLLTEGFDVWIDDRIDYGEDWWPIIVQAIRDCSAFVVLMTPDSDKSRWVQREVMIADDYPKPTYPLLLDGDLVSSKNWMIFVRTQYIDVRDGQLPPADFYDRLDESAHRHTKRGAEVLKKENIPAKSIPRTRQPSKAVITKQPAKKTVQPTGVLIDAATVIGQPFEWCRIPDGTVMLEDASIEGGSHGGKFDVYRHYISKYLVTNAQYQVFVDDQDGYCNQEWWDYSDEAIAWRKRQRTPRDTAFKGDDLPRTNVSWFDALAFGQWLTSKVLTLPDRTKFPIEVTLPTEQQWQWSAQGDDKRRFPWGNDFEKTHCNTPRSRNRMVTPVTKYTKGASPFGCLDMAGNVWEWCRTEWQSDDSHITGNRDRVVRGGSWDYMHQYAQVNYRKAFAPRAQNSYTGFRLAMVATK